MSSNSKSSAPAHPPTDEHDDTLEAHYSALERPCYCYGSGVVVLTIEEDGEEHIESVRCRRCNGETR